MDEGPPLFYLVAYHTRSVLPYATPALHDYFTVKKRLPLLGWHAHDTAAATDP